MAEDRSLAGEAFNFSTEHPVSVLEIVQQILKLMKADGVKPVLLNQAPNEIPKQYLNALKARERLGWRSRFTLEAGLRRTIAWYQEFFRREAEGRSAQAVRPRRRPSRTRQVAG